MCCWNLSSTSFNLNLSSGEFHVHPSYISRPWLPIHMSKYVTFSFSVLLAKGPSNIRVVYCRNDLYASGKFVELHDSDGGANPDVAISVASCGSFGSGISLTPCYNSSLLFDSRHSDTTVWSDSSTDSSSRERRDRQAKAVIREWCSREDERVRLSWAREWRRPYCCLATTTVKEGDHNIDLWANIDEEAFNFACEVVCVKLANTKSAYECSTGQHSQAPTRTPCPCTLDPMYCVDHEV